MYGDSYRRGFERVTTLIDGRDTNVNVPATPDWSTGDVIRHLAGNANDLVHRRIDGFASDEWTAAQVATRSLVPVHAVVEEWSSRLERVVEILDDIDHAGFVEPVVSAVGPLPLRAIPPMVVNDLIHHEFDMRNAYGDSSGRDLVDIRASAAGHARSLRAGFAYARLPTLRIEATDSGSGWNIGRGEVKATVRASSFEIMRSIGGRRTRTEIASLDWSSDPGAFVDAMVLPHLAMRTSSLNE